MKQNMKFKEENLRVEIDLLDLKGDEHVLPYLVSQGYQIANFENTYSHNEVIFSKPKHANVVYSLAERVAYVANPGMGITLEQGVYHFLKICDEYLGFEPTIRQLDLAPFLMQLGYGIITGELLFTEEFRVFRGGIQNKRIYHLVGLNKDEKISVNKYLKNMDALNPVARNVKGHKASEFYTSDLQVKAAALYAAKVLSGENPRELSKSMVENMKLAQFEVIPSKVFTRERSEQRKMIVNAAKEAGIDLE